MAIAKKRESLRIWLGLLSVGWSPILCRELQLPPTHEYPHPGRDRPRSPGGERISTRDLPGDAVRADGGVLRLRRARDLGGLRRLHDAPDLSDLRLDLARPRSPQPPPSEVAQ